MGVGDAVGSGSGVRAGVPPGEGLAFGVGDGVAAGVGVSCAIRFSEVAILADEVNRTSSKTTTVSTRKRLERTFFMELPFRKLLCSNHVS